MEYNCISKDLEIGIEWVGYVSEFTFAKTFINFKPDFRENLLWELQLNEIELEQYQFRINPFDATSLAKALGEYDELNYVCFLKKYICSTKFYFF